MEVAEHLSEKYADRFVKLLASLSDIIVFTAATPGQGGNGHVNEQPPSYWIAKFAALDFTEDELLAARWRTEWKNSAVVANWYYRNLLILRRNSKRGL
jgi:hypothetical protein